MLKPALAPRPIRRRFAALVFCALAGPLGVGCASDADGTAGGEGEDAETAGKARYGCDYSFARPSMSTLKKYGCTFVARYLSHSPAKDLSKGEAEELWKSGIDIVSNWEATATNALDGHAQGVADAKSAEAQAKADGAPAGRPIYFSVDFDASEGQQSAINAYFDGVASVIGRGRTGAYGGYYVIKRLFDAKKISYGWQAYAWSGGQWDKRAQMRQIQNGLDGDALDKDEAIDADFGQWHYKAPPPPDHAPDGYLDSATCAGVKGWAQDKDSPKTSIGVHIYYNAAAGKKGAVAVSGTASIDRSDLCKSLGSCDHGFSFTAPRSLMDDKAHEVYAYGVDTKSGGPAGSLKDSPRALTCAAPAIPKGYVKRHVTSTAIEKDWKFNNFLDVAPYAAATLAAVEEGTPFASAPKLVQIKGKPAIYVVDGALKRHVVSAASMTAWRFSASEVTPISAAELAKFDTGPDWLTAPLLAQSPGNAAIYLLDVAPPSDGAGGAAGGSGAAGSAGQAGAAGAAGESDAGQGGSDGGDGADGQTSAGGMMLDADGSDGAGGAGEAGERGAAGRGPSNSEVPVSMANDDSSGACSVAPRRAPAGVFGLAVLGLGAALGRRRRRA